MTLNRIGVRTTYRSDEAGSPRRFRAREAEEDFAG